MITVDQGSDTRHVYSWTFETTTLRARTTLRVDPVGRSLLGYECTVENLDGAVLDVRSSVADGAHRTAVRIEQVHDGPLEFEGVLTPDGPAAGRIEDGRLLGLHLQPFTVRRSGRAPSIVGTLRPTQRGAAVTRRRSKRADRVVADLERLRDLVTADAAGATTLDGSIEEVAGVGLKAFFCIAACELAYLIALASIAIVVVVAPVPDPSDAAALVAAVAALAMLMVCLANCATDFVIDLWLARPTTPRR
ncbi:MAG: hypothetical protein ACT4RN_21355 [Pseudonocardia sp.]